MSLSGHGVAISEVEVSNISTHGIWLYSHGKELFMSYDNFPWFKEKSVKSIINVEAQSRGHFYWPDLDVDLTEDIIEHPERFPLRARNT